MVRNIDKNGNDINLSETVVVLTPALATAVAKIKRTPCVNTMPKRIRKEVRNATSVIVA